MIYGMMMNYYLYHQAKTKKGLDSYIGPKILIAGYVLAPIVLALTVVALIVYILYLLFLRHFVKKKINKMIRGLEDGKFQFK